MCQSFHVIERRVKEFSTSYFNATDKLRSGGLQTIAIERQEPEIGAVSFPLLVFCEADKTIISVLLPKEHDTDNSTSETLNTAAPARIVSACGTSADQTVTSTTAVGGGTSAAVAVAEVEAM